VSRTPHGYRHQPACKPGSVGHRPLARTIRDGHSSGTTFAHCLEQPTRTASLTSLPHAAIAFANGARCRPYSVLLPVWFAMPVPLPEPRCALTAPFHPCCPPFRAGKRFVLCGTVTGVAPAGGYPAPYVDGARTFLSCSLSTVAGAPTPGTPHEHPPDERSRLDGTGDSPLTSNDRTRTRPNGDRVRVVLGPPAGQRRPGL